MFTDNSYEITRTLVADRQASLRNETRERRTGGRGRRARRGWRLSDLHNPAPGGTAVRERLFG